MPRIPDEQLERLKQDISLQRLVEARGIELKRHGAVVSHVISPAIFQLKSGATGEDFSHYSPW